MFPNGYRLPGLCGATLDRNSQMAAWSPMCRLLRCGRFAGRADCRRSLRLRKLRGGFPEPAIHAAINDYFQPMTEMRQQRTSAAAPTGIGEPHAKFAEPTRRNLPRPFWRYGRTIVMSSSSPEPRRTRSSMASPDGCSRTALCSVEYDSSSWPSTATMMSP